MAELVPRVDSKNSTYTPLSGGATFTGTWVDVRTYLSVIVAAKADVAGTLYVEFANTSIPSAAESTLSYEVVAGSNEVHRLTVTRPFCRVRYTNGASAQSTFGLTTLLGQHTLLSSPLNSVIQADADAIVTRSVPIEAEIALGKVAGHSIINVFGRNSDIDTTSVPEDVWAGGGVYTGFPTGAAELVTVTSSSVNDTALGSGARTVELSGLDANGVEQTEIITLNGTSLVDSVNTWTRVNRVVVLTSGSSNQAANTGIITVAHKTTTSNIFAQLPIGGNITQIGCYTVPTGKTALLQYVEVMLDRTTGAGTGTAQGALWIRPYNKSPYLYKSFSLSQSDEHQQNIYGGIALPALTDIAIRITSVSANDTIVYAHMDFTLVGD